MAIRKRRTLETLLRGTLFSTVRVVKVVFCILTNKVPLLSKICNMVGKFSRRVNFAKFIRGMVSPDSWESHLEVEEDRVKAEFGECGFVDFRLEV